MPNVETFSMVYLEIFPKSKPEIPSLKLKEKRRTKKINENNFQMKIPK